MAGSPVPLVQSEIPFVPTIFEVWDLDALRDGFIRREFLGQDDEPDGERTAAVARHRHTQNPLDSGAFLAVHLLRLGRGYRAPEVVDLSKEKEGDADGQCWNNYGAECNEAHGWGSLTPRLQRRGTALASYLRALPTVEQRLARSLPGAVNPHTHPLFWPARVLGSLFPPHTHTHNLVRDYRTMVESEFEALTRRSEEFKEHVTYPEYLNMRINVLSRTFGLPAFANDRGISWGLNNDDGKGRRSFMEEMRSYETSNFGRSLDKEKAVADHKIMLRSMCPNLDMYNSHPNPNVSWEFDAKSSSFVVHATDDIAPGHSIVVSYGKYTDGHMFAKYGFVNGDGSSHTEVSLAVFHQIRGDLGLSRQYSLLPYTLWDLHSRDEVFSMLDEDGIGEDSEIRQSLMTAKQVLTIQAKEMVKYLLFDDGYADCIGSDGSTNSNDHELKLLKLRHLVRLANYWNAWIVRLPPRFPDAQPLQMASTTEELRLDKKGAPVAVSANKIVSVCRLLSLHADDIDGNAISHLREGLVTSHTTPLSPSESHFFLEKHGDALEYRAKLCIVRLCNVALRRYTGYNHDEPEVVGSPKWNAWYILKGEVRTLGVLLQTAAAEADRLKSTAKGAMKAKMMMRDVACPLNYSLPLLDRL